MSFRNSGYLISLLASCLCFPAAHSQTSAEHLQVRMNDAIHLTKEARQLSKQVKKLTFRTREIIATQNERAQQMLAQRRLAERRLAALPESKSKFDLEVKESVDHPTTNSNRRVVADESKPILQNYADLVAKYHAALSAYLQHRKQVQEHAAAFHAAAQQQNSSSNTQPPIIVVPALESLAVRTQDACDAMQQAEGVLHSQEEELNAAIQMMMNNRKTLSAAQYAALWTQSEQRATSLQAGASNFDQGVVAKQQTITGNLHGKMQEAMRDGDYVLSQQVYGEEQRSSMLIHEEVKRATKHSQLAMQFLNQLQTLSPYGQTASNSGASSDNPDQFVDDDRSLAAEYEQVQSLYRQVQEASPQFHK